MSGRHRLRSLSNGARVAEVLLCTLLPPQELPAPAALSRGPIAAAHAADLLQGSERICRGAGRCGGGAAYTVPMHQWLRGLSRVAGVANLVGVAGGPVCAVGLAACRSGGLEERELPWSGGVPVVQDLTGDGIEDLLNAPQLRLYDGKTFQKVWDRRDEFDVRSAVVAGEVLAVAAPRELHVLGLRDGKTRHRLVLADEVRRLCPQDGALFVELIDDSAGRVDLAAGTFAAAAWPESCSPARSDRPAGCAVGSAECTGTDHRFELVSAGGRGSRVAVSIKERGTPEVTLHFASGAVPLSHELRLSSAELVGEVLFVKLGGVLAAFDAATGRERWQVSCSGQSRALLVTASRVYAECDGAKIYKALRVLDHAGKPLATFGRPR